MTDLISGTQSFRLPETFVEPWRRRPVRWGFDIGGDNALGEVIFLARYSRRLESGRKETWPECVRRIVEGVFCVLADHCRQAGLPWDRRRRQAFIDLKDPRVNPARLGPDGWGHLSNNSIVARQGDDLTHLAERIARNGEPGLFFLDNARRFGRLSDPPDERDSLAMGTNPCAEQTLEDKECCTLAEGTPGHGAYIRRLRCGKPGVLTAALASADYRVEPDAIDPSRLIAELPVRGQPGRVAAEVSVTEKARIAAMLQRHWADNQVSVTLTFRPEERAGLLDVMATASTTLKAVSFLPLVAGGAYAQMPYEPVDTARYDQMTRGIRPLDRDLLYREAAGPEGERFCDGDTCQPPAEPPGNGRKDQ